jgi:hypothetical protein
MKFGWMIWMALVALGAGNELRAQVAIEDGEIVLETPVGLDEEMAEYEPIDLRKSTASEIARLPGITMQDALSIVELLERNRRAGFETIAEIDGMTAEKLLVLRTNCTLGVLPPLQRQPARVSQRLRVRSELQRRRGYDQPLYRIVGGASDIDTITVASRYIGSPLAIV